MANQVEKLNGIAITSIEKVNGLTDAQIEKINGLEFTGSTDAQLISFATQDTGGTAIDGGTGFNTARSEGTSLAFDPDTNQVIIAFSDGGSSTVPTIRIGDKIVVSSDTNGTTSTGCHYDTNTNRLIVTYRSPYSAYWTNAGVFAKAFELNSSRGVDTAGSVATVFNSSGNNEVSRNNLSEIQDHDGVVDILYEDYSNGKDYVNTVKINDASACSLTVGSDAEFDTDSNHHFAIAYSPDVDRNVIMYTKGNALRARTITHFSGDPSLGSYANYGLSNCELDATDPHGGSCMIYDTEHNKFHFLFRYGGSSSSNAVNDNLYIGNLSVSGTSVTFASTSGTSMNNTVEIDDLKYGRHFGSNQPGAGLIYSHQRQRIIMHGNDANSETGGTKNFHIIDFNGSAYTKTSSYTAINTLNGAPWDTGAIRTDNASGTFGNVNLFSYFIYSGSNDGKTFIQGIDAGDSTIS